MRKFIFKALMSLYKYKLTDFGFLSDFKNYTREINTILCSLPDMAWATYPDGRAFYLNTKCHEYTGLSFEESIIKNRWTESFHPADVMKVKRSWLQSIRNKCSYETEARIKNVDGEYKWHLLRANCVKDENGEIKFWVGTLTDIHEKKLYQEQLELKNNELTRINADLDSFVYTASHDLRGPVYNLEGLLSLLSQCDEQEQCKNLIRMCKTSAEKLKNVITQLSEIIHIQKTANDEKENIYIPSILNDIKETINKTILDNNASISEDLQISEIKYIGKNFYSILYNLVSNAIKYKNPKRNPEILVKTYNEGNYTILSVSDNGLGFDLNDKHKIFTMFKRLHDHVEGTGVGLYMVKRMVDNEGGKIEVDSKKGEGSTFKIYFRNI